MGQHARLPGPSRIDMAATPNEMPPSRMACRMPMASANDEKPTPAKGMSPKKLSPANADTRPRRKVRRTLLHDGIGHAENQGHAHGHDEPCSLLPPRSSVPSAKPERASAALETAQKQAGKTLLRRDRSSRKSPQHRADAGDRHQVAKLVGAEMEHVA